MSERSKPDEELRETILRAVMARRACDRDEAEIIMARICDRLDDYTHAEAVQRHPIQGEQA